MEVVDVSSWQEGFDYQVAKVEGIEGVVIKRSGGTSYKNPYFRNQVANAQAAGMRVAAYHYMLEPTGDPGGPEEEADYFCSTLPAGWPYPVALDVEEANGRWPDQNEYVRRWIFRVRATLGVQTEFMYLGNYWVQEQNLKASHLGRSKLWLASWQDTLPPVPEGGPWDWITMWQYDSRATRGGMTPIDVNTFRGTPEAWDAMGVGGELIQVPKPSVGSVVNPGPLPPSNHEVHPYFWATWTLVNHGYPLGPAALYTDNRVRQLFERVVLGSNGRDEPTSQEGLGQAYNWETSMTVVDWPDVHPLVAADFTLRPRRVIKGRVEIGG